MQYESVIKKLYSIERKKGTRLGLKNIRLILKKIGNPHQNLKVIHVAGTNGKGSVCAITSSILQNAGYKVGMYTSPHLKDFRERFRINNKQISEKDVVKYYQKVKKHVTTQTFFEVITAMAFLYFKDKRVDYLVLEVGLGGRLDATNVITALISIITNIGIEHTDFLGKSIQQIAREKAGIIKPRVPIITGAKKTALQTIRKNAKQKKSPLYLNKKFKKTNGRFNINSYKNLKLNLKGNFQLTNASIAVTALEILQKYHNIKIKKTHIKQGLNSVKWAGRFEFINHNILVDCAHNPAALKVLIEEVKELNDYKKIITIIGILNDKNIKKMVKLIEQFTDKVILVQPKTARAEKPIKILKCFKDKSNVNIIRDTKKALQYAKINSSKKDLILVTGSCYVVGEVIK